MLVVLNLIICLVGVGGAYFIHRATALRSAVEVIQALSRDEQDDQPVPAELRRKKIRELFLPIALGGASGAFISLLLSVPSTTATVLFPVAGALLGAVFLPIRERRIKEEKKRKIEFILPVVMERLVMAVESGLDVIPAMQKIVELEEKNAQAQRVEIDPVTEKLQRIIQLCDKGITLERALTEAAEETEVTALRHAFVHLSLAYKEGGELINPLRELSDAAQQYFQESVEEEIAKLPVKATFPLVLTFGGLLILFLTGPIFKIKDFSSSKEFTNTKALPKI